jgi:single-strand DNA-binding protein
MASYNRVVLAGNLTRNPELRYTSSNTPVCEVGLAVNERTKGDDGQWVDAPIFVDLTMWQKTAELANQYLTKGSPVLIEGRLKMDRWQDKQTGQNRTKLCVTVDKLVFIGGGQDKQQATPTQQPASQPQAQQPAAQPQQFNQAVQETLPVDDEIPF